MTSISDLPLDLLIYKILTDPDLTPSDVLGLCKQPGFILLCRLSKVGRALMSRYYPGVQIDNDNPWRQFSELANRIKIRYVSSVEDSDVDQILYSGDSIQNQTFDLRSDHQNQTFDPVDVMRRQNLKRRKTEIYVDVYGVPISGQHLIGGFIDRSEPNEYKIYENKEKAIESLWGILVDMINAHNDPDRLQPSYHGKIDYKSPIEYPETYEQFRRDMLEKGFSLYHYYRTHEDPEYGDFSDYSTTIFSIHNVDFVFS